MNLSDIYRWQKERDSYILLSPNSIGEAVVVAGFCNAFKIKHKYKLRLVVRHEHEQIAQLYRDSIDDILCASMHDMRLFSELKILDGTKFEPGHPVNLWTKLRTDGRLSEIHDLRTSFPWRGGLGYSDLYRHLMHLDWDSKLQLKSLPEEIKVQVRQKIIELGFNPSTNNVIIFPSTNSNIPAPSECWTTICDRYHREGFNVYINYHGGDLSFFSPPSYAKVLKLGIFPSLVFAELCGNVLISSNGLVMLMLMLQVNTQLNVLLPNSVAISSKTTQKVSPLYGSHHFLVPELITSTPLIREFIGADNEAKYNDLAEAIVTRSSSENEVTNEVISNAFHESWLSAKNLSFSS